MAVTLTGWCSLQPAAGAGVEVTELMDGLRAAGATVVLADGVAIACEGVRASTWVAPDRRSVVVVLGRPRLDGRVLAGEPVAAQLIGQRLTTQGEGALLSIGGSFALCWFDVAARRLRLAVDHLGIERLAYAQRGNDVWFGTDARALARNAGATGLSAQAIFDYLFFHVVPAPDSAFAAVKRLRLAECVTIDAHGGARAATYWRPDAGDRSQPAAAELAVQLKQSLAAAVADMTDRPRTGAFLSGGIDSSTVAGLLQQLRGADACAFSIGFDAPGYDEMEFARQSARHFGIRHREYYVTPADVTALVTQIADRYDEPFGNSSAVPVFHCAQMARADGFNLLLAGDGGDELFGGNERYAKQQVFERYFRLPALLRHGFLEPLVGEPTLWESVPIARKARSYVRQARVPLPDRLQTYNYLCRTPADVMFQPQFRRLIDVDVPFESLRHRWREYEGRGSVDRMCYLDWKVALSDSDLPKVNGMAALAGIDVAYPFLDDRVVDLSVRVPDAWKVQGTELRHFYKAAMRDFLPGATISKTKHGFGLPFGIWMREDQSLNRLTRDAMAALAGRGIFQAAYLEDLQRRHREEHAAYYGEFLWVLMILELWLQRNIGAGPIPFSDGSG